MRTFLSLAIFAITISASASSFEGTAQLDFSNVYGNTNVGIYEMKVGFTPKTSISESKLSFNIHQDDGYFTCNTSANFKIGTLNFSLKNLVTGESTFVNEVIIASVGKQFDGQVCDENILDLGGNQTLYALTGPKDAIVLNVKAPFDYKMVGVYLSPFNGYLNLKGNLMINGDKLLLNPSKLLTMDSILSTNSGHLTATYYVFAQKEATSLSLATGMVDLN